MVAICTKALLVDITAPSLAHFKFQAKCSKKGINNTGLVRKKTFKRVKMTKNSYLNI